MNYILFTTTQCPKCPAFKEFIAENIDFDGEIINEQNSNFMDNVKIFGVSNAPTIVILENEKEVFRADDISQLAEFLKTH